MYGSINMKYFFIFLILIFNFFQINTHAKDSADTFFQLKIFEQKCQSDFKSFHHYFQYLEKKSNDCLTMR